MPNRIIKESIRTSKHVNALSDFQFRLWAYLITYVDDYGRGSADAEILKGLVFTRRKGVTEKQIADAMIQLANTGMITLYEVDGESFFYFPSWDKHQTIRAKKSKFPEPASNCKQLQADACNCPRNPIQSNPNPNPNTEKAPVRHKHGEYANVLLTDAEMEKLKAEFPDDYADRIERLSAYIAQTGKSYKSHLATIRNWARRDSEKVAGGADRQRSGPTTGDIERMQKMLKEMQNE